MQGLDGENGEECAMSSTKSTPTKAAKNTMQSERETFDAVVTHHRIMNAIKKREKKRMNFREILKKVP